MVEKRQKSQYTGVVLVEPVSLMRCLLASIVLQGHFLTVYMAASALARWPYASLPSVVVAFHSPVALGRHEQPKKKFSHHEPPVLSILVPFPASRQADLTR